MPSTPPTKKNRPFAVFDIDGTLIRWQLYHAIADMLAKQGVIKASVYDTIHEARMAWKRRTHQESFKAYEKHLVETYDELLRELSVEDFERAALAVFAEFKDQAYTYTRDLIHDLKKQKYLLFAISGSQIEIVEMIAKYYGFDDWIGTIHLRKGEHFTGKKVVAAFEKGEALQKLITKHHASYQNSIGVGDSSGDIAMLEMVDQPIAFNPEKKLFAHAKKLGWPMVIERKNKVYKLERRDGDYILA